jgi:hypothetical protein
MNTLRNLWNALMDWAEEINEHRRKNGIRSMY